MNIVITAVQGRGKTLLADRIASMFAPKHHVIEIEYDHAELRYDRIVRDARADVVIIDALPDYHVADAQLAMQIARDALHKSFIVIYCVQDVVGGESGKTPWLPGGFVTPFNAAMPDPEVRDAIDTALLYGPIDSHPDPVINKRVRELRADGETVYVKKAYTFDILAGLFTRCLDSTNELSEAAHNIVDRFTTKTGDLGSIDPVFYPTIHDALRPLADWAKCGDELRHLHAAGMASHAKTILTLYVSGQQAALVNVPFEDGTTLLNHLKSVEC